MALTTWRSPFPLHLGGDSTKRITKLYDRLCSEVGDAITTEQDTVNGGELVATARMLSIADRAIDRRRLQDIDPRKLTDPRLARWESVLGIIRSVNDSDAARRRRVASRLLTSYGATSGSLSRLAAEAFSPWTTQVRYHDAATAMTLWPDSTPADATAWTSSVALITVEYIRPTSASDADCKARVDACSAALDEYLPAWATFCCSETFEGDAFGFYCGVSRLSHTALT